MHRFILSTGLVLFAVVPVPAQAQPTTLSLNEALARARAASPAVIAARMRIDEARSRIVGASLPFTTNPTVDVEAGRRSGDVSSTDYGVAIAQELDLPQRRRARLDAARAAVAQEEQRTRDVERDTLREVAITYVRAVEARERAEAAATGKRLADEALRIASRRYAAGDVAQLDVNLARTAVARAEAESRGAAATLTGHLTALQVLLGFAQPVAVSGSLRQELTAETQDLVAGAAERPDIRLLDAEIAEAEAEQRLAATLRWPDVGLRAAYNEEEGDRVVMAGVGVTLPVFNRGQEAVAATSARLARLRVERDGRLRSAEAEIRGAVASFDALRSAVAEYQRTVLPLVEGNEQLALESYEAGQIGLSELLVVRRDALDARRAFIDHLIETRLAEVELRARAGVWK